jgi:hypothetical protein
MSWLTAIACGKKIWTGFCLKEFEKMKRFAVIVSALAVLLLAAAWAQGASTGTVNGNVTLNGAALANVAVVLTSSGSSAYTGKATTDANGNFSVTDAPVGTVEVKAYDAQGGFLISTTGIINKAGDVITLALNATR